MATFLETIIIPRATVTAAFSPLSSASPSSLSTAASVAFSRRLTSSAAAAATLSLRRHPRRRTSAVRASSDSSDTTLRHVIGVITMFLEVEEKRGYKKMSIEINDEGKRRLRLTVWEAYFPEVQKIVDACKSLQEKPILVLKCVQRKEWHGTVTLSTVRFATKFELNPEIPEVAAFRNRINEISNNALVGPVVESSVNTSKILTGAKIKSLADILKTTKAGYYVTLIYIEDMNLSHNWYFNSCPECMTKVTKEGDNLWYCKKQSCSKSNVGVEKSDQRFQMKADITDGGDVRAQLMLWDAPIYNMIGKSASTILEEQEQEGHREAVPLEFRGLIEREFVAKFYVSKEFNIDQKSKCFKATQLCADEDVISKWKELEASTKSTEMSQNSTALTISHATVSQSDVQLLVSLKDTSDEELENTPTSKLLLKRSYDVDEDCEIVAVQNTPDQASSSKDNVAKKAIKIEK